MKNERPLLLTLAVVQFNHIVDFMLMMPLGPQLMRALQIDPRQFSLLVSAYTISAGIFGFAGAFFLDRFERKRALQIVFIAFVLGTFICGLAGNYYLLMAARIFTGAFGGLLSSLILSIVGDAIPLERRSSAMGIIMTAFAMASIAGVPAGMFLANQFGWNMPFIILAAFSVFAHLAIMRFVPVMDIHLQGQPTKPDLMEPFRMVAQHPDQQRALWLQFFMMMGHFSLIPFLSPYMVSNVGFSEQELPLIYLFGGLVSMLSLPLIGKIADKHGRYRVMIFGILLSAIPQLIITHMPPVPVWVALCVTTFFFITTGGRNIPASTIISSTAAPHQRGKFMSLNVAVQQLSSGLAAFMAGQIVSKSSGGELLHYPIVGYLAIGFSLAGLYIARTIRSQY